MSPSSWSLRRRLTLAMVGLISVITLTIAILSVVALRAYLIDELDSQLVTTLQRSQTAVQGNGPQDWGRPLRAGDNALQRLLGPGQGADTVAGVIGANGVQRAAVIDQAGRLQPLSMAEQDVLFDTPVDGATRSVDLAGDLGAYRVVAAPGVDGDTIVTGLALSGVQAAVTRLIIVTSIVALVAALAALIAGSLIVRAALRPLERVAGTATRVAHLPLDSGEVSLAERVPTGDTNPATEVGQVGAALNQMLGHVEDALSQREANERKTRQFVADASHELRTPLAAILGYAELTRRAPHTLPPDVTHAMDRVESEANRMNAMVADLLLLARLDSGPELVVESVDLRVVVADALSDAHAAGPGHKWSIELPEYEVLVDGDPDRLHQIVANVLTNARTHTPEGTSVGLVLAQREGYGDIVVTDTGPGIPPELLDGVFERFVRGDSSRSRRAGSTGLGLSIVSAIAAAHGGEVRVQSVPGRTSFTISLPVSPATPGAQD
ncbi:MAG: HAMP domain-containing sensor histidine kinase [Ornithinimicrobium sp.]